MKELGLWDSAFKNVLIHHKLMSTTFTYSKDTMSYEFVNISDYPDSYILILRDPLIRAYMGNAGNIQSLPPTGYSPRFHPKVLPPLNWSKRYLSAIKAWNVPFGPENTTPDFVPTYHHVPDMVKSINNNNKDNIPTQIPTGTLPGKTLVSNKLVNSQTKQSIPTNKIASKQQEQFDALQGNQVSQDYTPFYTPINITSNYDDDFYTPRVDSTQKLPFVTPLGTEDTQFDNSTFSTFKTPSQGKTAQSPPTSMVSYKATRNVDSDQRINTNYPISTIPRPSTMTTLTSVTPSSNIHTPVVKKVAPYPTPRLRTTNQEGPIVTSIT